MNPRAIKTLVISLLMNPITGFLYTSGIRKAIQVFLIMLAFQITGLAILLTLTAFAPWNAIVGLSIIMLPLFVFIILAVKSSKNPLPALPSKRYQRILLYIGCYASVLLVPIVLKGANILKASSITAGSMESAILTGELTLGTKTTTANHGEIVVFNKTPKTDFVSRCVAISGDTIEVSSTQVTINGVKEKRIPSLQWIRSGELVPGITFFSKLFIPRKGDTLKVSDAPLREFIFYKHLIRQENPRKRINESFDIFINGNNYTDSTLTILGIDPENKVIQYLGLSEGMTIKFRDLSPQFYQLHQMEDWSQYSFYLDLWKNVYAHITGSDSIKFVTKLYIDGQEISSYMTKYDCYFMLGDNRDNSLDSRYWGFVSQKSIRSKPQVIYYSQSKKTGEIRFDRLGIKVQ